MQDNQIQAAFFRQIKNQLPTHISLVDTVAELLDISNDSSYRRIRGEKPISIEEMQKLATHFKVSIDKLLHLQSDAFIFNGRITNSSDFTYENWLQLVVKHLEVILQYNPCYLSYFAKELPAWYYFMFPEIAAFKSFFFMKSILYYKDFKGAKFSVKDDYSHFLPIWKRISDTFSQVPSTEIWFIENITSTLHQIEFYRLTGFLKSDDDAIAVIEKLEELMNHLEIQAEYGVKLKYGQNPATSGVPFRMFVNDIVMGDNMQIVQLGDTFVTYLNHSILNFIYTTDEAFNNYMRVIFETITQKSTLISEVNEKDRILFFNRLRAKIKAARDLVEKNEITL